MFVSVCSFQAEALYEQDRRRICGVICWSYYKLTRCHPRENAIFIFLLPWFLDIPVVFFKAALTVFQNKEPPLVRWKKYFVTKQSSKLPLWNDRQLLGRPESRRLMI